MRVNKFAAIDIGSNAIRLLFTNVVDNFTSTEYKKVSLIRVPLRLGGDTFTNHIISRTSARKLEQTMKAFQHLMQVHDVVGYRACATSAMREAANGVDLVERIRKKTGIHIEIIGGKEEAEIIFANGLTAEMDARKTYLYMDVGGGSTELTLFHRNRALRSHSFNIGTIRMMNGQVTKAEWKYMKSWVLEATKKRHNISLIGSGGNINKIFKISGTLAGTPLDIDQMKQLYTVLSEHSYEERIKVFDLNLDRADVIVPAARIFLSVMKWGRINHIHVPKIGVSDGIIRQLHRKYVDGLEKKKKKKD